MKAVLLVGGEGTRLRPLTYDVPKPLFPVAGVPYLEQLAHYLSRFGVEEMILTSCYLSEQIRDFCRQKGNSGFKLTYLVEETPLGTGGAVANAAPLLDRTALVLNGDILTNFDLQRLQDFHREKKASFTLALTPVEDPSRYGVAELTAESRVARFVEKPAAGEAPSNYINAGMYLVEPEILEHIPRGRKVSIEKEVFPVLSQRGKLFGCVMRGYWMDMGTPLDYLKVHFDFLERKILLQESASRDGQNWMGKNVRVHPGAETVPPVFLGDGCFVAAGARVGPASVLGRGCAVGENAVVERSVLWERARVHKNARVTGTIAGSGCVIPENDVCENRILRSRSCTPSL